MENIARKSNGNKYNVMNLQNNSPEMKTVVETFVIEETAELIYDNDKLDQWNKHVEELALIGQKKIVKPDKSPVPFLHLKQGMKNVFEVLCPRKVSIESYDVTPIPVEILDLVALSKRETYFHIIEIWYDDKSKDPACVGIIKKYGEWNKYNWDTREEAIAALGKDVSEYGYEQTYYLIGRWADVKHSFDELKELAVKRYMAQKENEFKTIIKELQRKMDDIQTDTFNYFN